MNKLTQMVANLMAVRLSPERLYGPASSTVVCSPFESFSLRKVSLMFLQLRSGGRVRRATLLLVAVLLVSPAIASAAAFFTIPASLETFLGGHAVTLLDGRVLIFGGTGNGSCGTAQSAWLYDPVLRTFSMTGTPASPHR